MKADALSARLRAIRDDLEVVVMDSDGDGWLSDLLSADLLIDATVSRSVTRLFDAVAQLPDRRAVFAQVATDARTGTLGLLTLAAAPGKQAVELDTPTLTEIDERAGDLVRAESGLEAYRVFWDEPVAGDEFVPTRGCSVPTFHGSAADLAAVAGVLVNFVALHIDQAVSGTHLASLPHSGVVPSHRFIQHTSGLAAADSGGAAA